MINLKSLLVPTDFSENSELALRYAVEFGRAFDAELHILHVVDDPVLMDDSTDASYREQAIDKAIRQIDEWIGRQVTDCKCRVVTRCDTASHAIVKYAKEAGIDMIIQGARGRSGVMNVLLGSVASHVVNRAPCPVMTVKHPEVDFIEDSESP